MTSLLNSSLPFDPSRLQVAQGRLESEIERRRQKTIQARKGGLIEFVRYFWDVLEPNTPLIDGWPLETVCRHLEAVTSGDITRLLLNVPPGFMKSLLTQVFWPAWEWSAMNRPYLRYVTFSYSASLTERDNGRFRDLLLSPKFQELWGTRFDVTTIGVVRVGNNKTGWKLASSVGGVGTGERGDRAILDDPHNVKEAESELIRGETVRWFRESMSNRLNNMETSAIVVIMQRVNEADVAGTILEKGMGYTHVMVPMEFDVGRVCETEIGWRDPRTVDGDLAWPARFSEGVVVGLKRDLGPYAYASQYQQAPMPRGGGIFQRAWWQLYESPDGKFPAFDYLLASLDSAFTEKEENDPSAITVWGVFSAPSFEAGRVDEKTGHIWQVSGPKQRRIMLVHAWRKHLAFSADRSLLETRPNESHQAWRRRTQEHWGLMEWVNDTCGRFKVDKLLIEAKASGISAAQELRNRFGLQNWAVQLCPVQGDKVARALSVQPVFSQQTIYAPARDWAEQLIDEASTFPKGRYDDLTDSMTQAIAYLRSVGLAQSDDESLAAEQDRARHRPQLKPVYPI